jgi:methyl-accepting chemotaxis protein
MLTQLRIGARLWTLSVLMIVLLLSLCAAAALMARKLAADLETTASVDLVELRKMGQLRDWAGQAAASSRELLIIDSAGQIKKQKELLQRVVTDSQALLAAFSKKDGLVADQRAAVEGLSTAQLAFAQAIGKFLTVYAAGNPDDSRAALLMEVRPLQQAYEKQLDAVVAVVEQQSAARVADGQAVARWAVRAALLIGLVSALVALAGAWLITRSITQPLAQATEAARRIQAGDLSVSLDTQARDEIGDLQRAMHAMQSHLTGVLREVLASARDVATSSDELSQGNTELSTRTEQAAANLQQTASAMEQISSTVAGSSVKSHDASEAAQQARDAVVAGGEAVQQLVQTMTKIAGSSSRIRDIISVIDGIAFQTNILALNAAVEAARAGEQGRGFAVVAGEVRTLAARAGEAAREIKRLIEDSAERVDEGTRTVSDVGERIGAVVSQVMSVRQLIEEVSVAGREQASGMGSVNASVSQLDQSTQQNAALVEEIAATAGALKQHASRLVSSVEFFRLPQHA